MFYSSDTFFFFILPAHNFATGLKTLCDQRSSLDVTPQREVGSHLSLSALESCRVIRPWPRFSNIKQRRRSEAGGWFTGLVLYMTRGPRAHLSPHYLVLPPVEIKQHLLFPDSLTSCKDVISDAAQRLDLIKGRT